MFAKVNYDDANGRSKSLQLRAGQRVSVGASFSADIVLGNSQGVASEHAEIFFKHRKCSIKNLSGAVDSVLLNGKPMAKAELADGDRVEIGNNQLVFELEIPAVRATSSAATGAAMVAATATTTMAATATATESMDPQSESDRPTGPQFERQPNGTVVITVDSFESLVHPHLNRAESPWKYGVICNHQLSQRKTDPPEGTNYLGGMTGEVPENNDLYYVAFEERAAAVKEFLAYAASGAGLLAINGPATQDVDSAQQLKFLATWFIVPASLKFHLVNGSSLLLNKVFGLFDMLVIADIDGSQDFIIVNDPVIDSFDAFIEKIKGATNAPGN